MYRSVCRTLSYLTLWLLVYSGAWGTEVSRRVQGRSPGRRSERRSPSEAEAVCRHCFHILTAETIKIWQFCTIRLLEQYVLQLGLSDILGCLVP